MARSSSTNKKAAVRGGAAAKGARGRTAKGDELRGNSKRAEAAPQATPSTAGEGAGRDIAGVVLAVVAVASFIAVVAPSSAPVTRVVSSFYHLGFGLGAYVLPLVLLALAVGLFLRERSPFNARVLGGAALVFCAVLAMLSLLVPSGAASSGALLETENLMVSGGYLGAFLASALQTAFGTTISLVLLVGLAVVGLVIIGFSVSDFVRALTERVRDVADEVAARRSVEVNRAPWGDEEAAADTAKTKVIESRESKSAGRSRGQQRIPLEDEEGAAPTTFLGAREKSVLNEGARSGSASDAAVAADRDDEDEDPLVDLSAQLEAERAAEGAKTRLIPVKERYVEVEGPVEVSYAAHAAIGVAPVLPTIDAAVKPVGAFQDVSAAADAAGDFALEDNGADATGAPVSSMEAPLPPFVDLPDDDEGEGAGEAAAAPEPVAKTVPTAAIPAFLLAHTDTAPLPASNGAGETEAAPAPVEESSGEPVSLSGTGTAEASGAKAKKKAAPRRAAVEEPSAGDPAGRSLPPLSMLRHNPNSASAASSEQELEQTAQGLQATLQEFGLHARVTGWIAGPTVTTFKVQPGEGERVSRIANLEDDIALSLAAQSVRIFAPIPGTSLVGIEIPNAKRQNVNLADVLPYVKGGPLELAVGRDAEGTPVVADLAKMPHLLIAGTTGSGKSVMINSIVMTLLMRTFPEDVRLIMVDPKRVELAGYNGLPHLYVPVVTEPKQAASALQWAVSEMERRLKVFERLSVRKISTFNEKQQAGEFAHYDNPPQKMPYLVIIIDELSDLMMVAGKDVEASIVRIAQLGRAAGIHLIVATQRPSSNVVTGLIKANITNRIAFNVATGVDSRVIIDQTGAEKLTGLGDMLFSKVGWGKPKRIQGCFVSDDEIFQVVEFVKSQSGTDYHEEILSAVAPSPLSGGGGAPEPTEDDPLLWEAAHIVVDSQLGSTSGLQRRLKVGYARAGRIMDMLEEKGVVGPPDGSKPREVLLDEEGLAALEALEGPLSSEEVEGF